MDSPQPESPRPLKIRRYANRRFYDSTRSCHVTQEEMHRLVQEGYDLQITDATTGEDITVRVLTQLLMDMEAAKLNVFPVALLHQIIRGNQSLVGEFSGAFNQMLGLFLQSRNQFEEQMRRSMSWAGGAPPADWMKNPWGGPPAFWPQAEPSTEPSASRRQEGPGDAADLKGSVQSLHKQVQDLQAELKRMKTRK